MAITLVPEPTTGAPITSSDYDLQNALIAANEVPDLSFLTDWELDAAEPLLKKGVNIYNSGNTYIIDTADEAISGSPSAGLNYIELTLSGSTLTAAWVTSTTATFNPAYGGLYTGAGKQHLPDICYLDGADYIRGRSMGMDYNFIYLANGNFLISGGFDSLGADINTSGGDLDTDGGNIEIGSGNVNIGIGELVIDSDNFPSAPSTSSTSITSGSSWVVPKGIFFISMTPSSSPTFDIERDSGTWDLIHRYSSQSAPVTATLPSDGTNVRIRFASGSGTITIKWIKS